MSNATDPLNPPPMLSLRRFLLTSVTALALVVALIVNFAVRQAEPYYNHIFGSLSLPGLTVLVLQAGHWAGLLPGVMALVVGFFTFRREPTERQTLLLGIGFVLLLSALLCLSIVGLLLPLSGQIISSMR